MSMAAGSAICLTISSGERSFVTRAFHRSSCICAMNLSAPSRFAICFTSGGAAASGAASTVAPAPCSGCAGSRHIHRRARVQARRRLRVEAAEARDVHHERRARRQRFGHDDAHRLRAVAAVGLRDEHALDGLSLTSGSRRRRRPRRPRPWEASPRRPPPPTISTSDGPTPRSRASRAEGRARDARACSLTPSACSHHLRRAVRGSLGSRRSRRATANDDAAATPPTVRAAVDEVESWPRAEAPARKQAADGIADEDDPAPPRPGPRSSPSRTTSTRASATA